MVKEMNKQEYDAPMVELIEARVEKGFAGSFGSPVGSALNEDEPINGDALFS